MIVNDKAAEQRLESPMNLINRLRSESGNGRNGKSDAMALFTGRTRSDKPAVKTLDRIDKSQTFDPFKYPDTNPLAPREEQTKLDSIIHDADSEIKLGLTHNNAINLLHDAVEALKVKLDDVKADKLPAVISSASKVVESIRKERNEVNRNNKDREVHYHFYTPEQRKVSDYEIVEVQ